MTEVSELQQQLLTLYEELRGEQQEKCQALAKVEILELGIETARESERKMLDSLASQTKQLVQTKIALEEAKLEMKHLKNTIRIMEEDPRETQRLRLELKKVLEADEKGRKAMDDLAIALKEVTTESNRAKKSFFQAEAELERLRAEVSRLKLELEESTAASRAKENGFVNSIKKSEEEIACIKEENKRLTETKKVAREEISNLREIVKQAVRESNVAKGALEMARSENAQLRSMLLKGGNESVQELNRLLATTPSADSRLVAGGGKPLVKYPSENWSARWSLVRDPNLLEGSIFDMIAPSAARKEDDVGDVDDHGMSEGDPTMMLKKKRPGLHKFRSMLKMRSFNK